ncbi:MULTISPECIES: glycosyltransferase family 2 protein [Serratia]|uniref:Glycosyltransferase family 2 protein n=1 Tax=Serratia proteamaculans TaxID=28151 RepID=A0ABS0TSS5_SERPR|nr:glycosyltransferase family 2 protein [Serratia quinivorans]MBI6180538.1 glycosyltransferase family 2 protein [Serratia proteamaculans]CAI0854903.1 rhamnosyltransferase [Serratia quinivorans]
MSEHQAISHTSATVDENINNHKIAAVIISYHPELGNLTTLIEELKRQQVPSVLVDNGSLEPSVVEELSRLATVVRLCENVGIAKAQNIGVEHARTVHDAELIVFFDQDSHIDENFITGLLQDYYQVSATEQVAAIGPIFTDSRYGFHYPLIRVNKLGWRTKVLPQLQTAPFEVSMIISSGSLIPMAVLLDVGYMDESLFIDYVDTEWCLRAVAKGYKIYAATSAKMSHAIGDRAMKVLVWHVPMHSAFRRYYRLRNGLFLARMKHIPPLMKIRENVFNAIHQLLLIATQPNKKTHLATWCRAVKDGLSSK